VSHIIKALKNDEKRVKLMILLEPTSGLEPLTC